MVLELEDLFQKNGYSEKEFRLDMAILVYQRNVASLARAAKLAGVSKQNFETVLEERAYLTKKLNPLLPQKGFWLFCPLTTLCVLSLSLCENT